MFNPWPLSPHQPRSERFGAQLSVLIKLVLLHLVITLQLGTHRELECESCRGELTSRGSGSPSSDTSLQTSAGICCGDHLARVPIRPEGKPSVGIRSRQALSSRSSAYYFGGEVRALQTRTSFRPPWIIITAIIIPPMSATTRYSITAAEWTYKRLWGAQNTKVTITTIAVTTITVTTIMVTIIRVTTITVTTIRYSKCIITTTTTMTVIETTTATIATTREITSRTKCPFQWTGKSLWRSQRQSS